MDRRAAHHDAALALALAVLPDVSDLWGRGWQVDHDDDGPTEAHPGSRPETCLPPDLPDELAGAEAIALRDEAIVHAMSSVLATSAAARRVWSALATESFARCHAASVLDEVGESGQLTILGPVVPPSSFSLDRTGTRVVTHRAVCSGADAAGVVPIVLDLAAIAAGRALVVLMAVDARRHEADAGWPELITATVDRAVLATATEPS